MTTSSSWIRKTVLATLLAASAGVVGADDGVGRFSDSYRYFASQPTTESPSEWRAANPNGLSVRQLQGSSGVGETWKLNRAVFDKAPSEFRLANPNGLSELQYQALSSPGPAWHSSPGARPLISGSEATIAQGAGRETVASRVAQFFRATKSDVRAQ